MPVAFCRSGSSGSRSFSSDPASTRSAGGPVLALEQAPSQPAAATASSSAPASFMRILASRSLGGATRQGELAGRRVRLLGPLQIGLRLGHLGRERVDGLLHVVEGLHLVVVDLIDRGVDVVESLLELLE